MTVFDTVTDKKITSVDICTPTKMLARIIFRQDYMQFWGHRITIGLRRKVVNA